jgi:hypothetical protein
VSGMMARCFGRSFSLARATSAFASATVNDSGQGVRPPAFLFVTEGMRLFSSPHPQLSVIPLHWLSQTTVYQDPVDSGKNSASAKKNLSLIMKTLKNTDDVGGQNKMFLLTASGSKLKGT